MRVSLPALAPFMLSVFALAFVPQHARATPVTVAAYPSTVTQSTAGAEPVLESEVAEPADAWAPQSKEIWYGTPIAVVDGVALASFVGAVASDSSSARGVLLPLSTLGYSLAGPVVHWIHGHFGRGFASLGMRAVFPSSGLALGAFLGGRVGTNEGFTNSGALLGALAGFGLGLGGAVAVDLIVFAWESPTDETESLRLAPLVLAGTTGSTRSGASTRLPLRLGVQGAW